MSNETERLAKIEKLSAINMLEGISIIFDNGGSTTLKLSREAGCQTIEWQHTYDTIDSQIVNDIIAWIDGENPLDWEGNEIENGELIPTYEDERNGGYRECFCIDDIIRAGNGFGGNAKYLCDAMGLVI